MCTPTVKPHCGAGVGLAMEIVQEVCGGCNPTVLFHRVFRWITWADPYMNRSNRSCFGPIRLTAVAIYRCTSSVETSSSGGVRNHVELFFLLFPKVDSMCDAVVGRTTDELVDEHKKGARAIWVLLLLIMSSCESPIHLREHHATSRLTRPFQQDVPKLSCDETWRKLSCVKYHFTSV